MAKFEDEKKNLQEGAQAASATEQAIRRAVAEAARLTDESRSLTEELKEQLGIRSQTNETERALLGISRDITRSSQENKVALGQQGIIEKQLVKENNQLLAAKREQLIAEQSLGTEQVEKANKIAQLNQERLSSQKEIESIEKGINKAISEGNELQAALGAKELANARGEQASLEKKLSDILKTADIETQRLAVSNQLVSTAEKNIELSEEELAIQQQINDAMGITGGLLAGLNKVAGKFSGALGLDKVEQSMRDFTEEAIRGEKSVSRLQTLGVGLKQAFSNLGDFFTDPAVIIGSIITSFTAFEKQQKEFRKLTGQNAQNFEVINGSLTNSIDQTKALVALTKELGVNAQVVFSPETITEVAELTELMGMAGAEAANLAKLSKLSGTNLKDNVKQIEGSFQNFVKTNGVALNFGDVMSDVAKVSDATALSLGNNPPEIQKAALEARKLGLSLEQVDKIASSLLDFESSISSELEAELLTGQQINLEKAREAALNNDIATLSQEIGKNQAVLQAFATGNRIEQEAVAKAMGLSRDEVASMIVQQKLQSGLSMAQASAAADVSIEEAKRLTTQEQITKSLEKLSAAFAPILSKFASLIDNTTALSVVVGGLAAIYVTRLAAGFATSIAQLGVLLGLKTANTTATVAQTAATSAQAVANTTLATSQTAVATTGAAASGGLAAAGASLGAFGTAAAPAIPVLLTLAAVFASIGVAAAGLGFGFKMAADGFVKIMDNVSMDKLQPLFLLGPALGSVAAGLLSVASAGLLALPVLGALTALGTVSEGLGSMFGEEGGTAGGEGSMKAVEDKLDRLISVVEAGGDVYIDGSKVGKTLQLASSRMG